MRERQDWTTWLDVLDEVRPTPEAVKEQIRQRVLASATEQHDGVVDIGAEASRWFESRGPETDELHLTAVDLVPVDPDEASFRRRPIALAVGSAAALVIAIVVWFGVLDRSSSDVTASPFPNRSSEVACERLHVVSQDLDFLASDGPALTAEQLDILSEAVAQFVEELGVTGFDDPEDDQRWRAASAQLRQAAIFAGGGDTGRASTLLDRSRDQVANLVRNTAHPAVESCFDDRSG